MSTRYIYNIALGLAGAFLALAALAFTPPVVAALSFAIAAGVTVVSAATIPTKVGMIQRGLSGLTLVLGAWTVVASLVFFPTTVVWLGFGAGAAMAALALAGLTAHELSSERVVHSIQVEHTHPELVTD